MKENENTLIHFASEIGALKQGFKDLSGKMTTHLADHKSDKRMQWFIIGLQVVVLIFLSYLKFNGI